MRRWGRAVRADGGVGHAARGMGAVRAEAGDDCLAEAFSGVRRYVLDTGRSSQGGGGAGALSAGDRWGKRRLWDRLCRRLHRRRGIVPRCGACRSRGGSVRSAGRVCGRRGVHTRAHVVRGRFRGTGTGRRTRRKWTAEPRRTLARSVSATPFEPLSPAVHGQVPPDRFRAARARPPQRAEATEPCSVSNGNQQRSASACAHVVGHHLRERGDVARQTSEVAAHHDVRLHRGCSAANDCPLLNSRPLRRRGDEGKSGRDDLPLLSRL